MTSTRSSHRPTAVVTGASRGLGRAWSETLVDDGWMVVGDGRDEATLRTTAAALGPSFVAVAGDVTDARHRRDLAAAVTAAGGALDLLVHNAGALGPTPLPRLVDVDVDELASLFRVNVAAPVALTRVLLPMLERATGTVVVVTSDAARASYEGWGAYGATKAALEHVAGTLAAEHSALRVLALDPGDVRTAMHQAAFPGEDISDRADPSVVGPAVLALLRSDAASGSRHVAGALLADARSAT